ncbi:MAG: Ig-like domain-containing protein, partial [bacterium]|nr:Ig-like domain-containing protein [bacterium]
MCFADPIVLVYDTIPLIILKTKPTSPQTIGRPYLVQAIIKDLEKKGGKSVAAESLYYRVNSGTWSSLGAGEIEGETFSFWIPAIDSGQIEYYLQAWDNVGATTVEPSSGYHSFDVNTLPPVITYSYPDSGAINVAPPDAQILIVFSTPIDTTSFSFILLPDPGGVVGIWNTGHDTLRITHADFYNETVETVNITYAADLFGHLLSGRNVIAFTTFAPTDPYWEDRFGTTGINNTIYAMVRDSLNNVYIGGEFTTAGGASANYVAKWNGANWTALGSGMNGKVNCLAIIGTNVYAGGGFTTAGGVTVNRIAKWNGTSWSALGSGMSASVYTVAVNGNDVYAGGTFATAGGVSVNSIAKWNGTSWSALGSGMSGVVYTVAVNGNDVYAGGGFTTAGGVTVNRIAKW